MRQSCGELQFSSKINRTIKTNVRLVAKTIRQGIEFGRRRIPGQISEDRFHPPLRVWHSRRIRTSFSKAAFSGGAFSATGITWRHENGRSPDYFLPETTGA